MSKFYLDLGQNDIDQLSSKELDGLIKDKLAGKKTKKKMKKKKKTVPISDPEVIEHCEILVRKFLKTRDMVFEKTDYGKNGLKKYKIFDRMGRYLGHFRNIERFVKEHEIDKYPPESPKITKWHDQKIAAEIRKAREALRPEYYKMLYDVDQFWFRRRQRFPGPSKDCFEPKRKKVHRTLSDAESAARRVKKHERAKKKLQERIERKRIRMQTYFGKFEKQSNRPKLVKRKKK